MDNPYDTGFEEEEEDFQSQGYESSKELLIFLIDAQSDMLQKANLDEDNPDDTYIDIAIKQAAQVMKSRIISSSSDEIAVVFYGTRERGEHSRFDHIYPFLDLDVPDASRIRSLTNLSAAKFQKEIGTRQADKMAPGEVFKDLKLALWTCSQLFTNKNSKASRRLLLFTNNEDPCKDSMRDQSNKDQIVARAEELHDSGVTLSLFPIIAAQHPFDMEVFWQPVLEKLRDENDGAEPMNVVAQMSQLIETVRRRTYKKRAFRSINWTLGPGLELAVQMYNMVQLANKGATIWLDAKTNEPLRSETAYVCGDTGAVMSNIDKKYYEVKTGDKLRFPKVVLLNQEVVQVKSIKPLGLKLLGFKPLSYLQDYHQMRASHFIYPAEHRIKGSTRLFHALYLSLCTQNQMAICTFVSRSDAMPVLVALIPQPEELQDETGLQVSPPGLNMIYLPFADDMRYPDNEPSYVGMTAQRADASQVAAAEAVINALTLDPSFTTATEIRNPHIQRHFDVLEAIALEEAVPENTEDDTLPDPEGLARAESDIQKFKDAVFGANYQASGKGKAGGKGTKRKAEDDAAPEYGQYQWKQLAGSTALDKLKVDELKLYLQHHRLNVTGRKAELVERIRNHLKG